MIQVVVSHTPPKFPRISNIEAFVTDGSVSHSCRLDAENKEKKLNITS